MRARCAGRCLGWVLVSCVTAVMHWTPLAALAEHAVGETRILATVAGRYATPSAGQEDIRFYGTDLGWTFEHEGRLWVLFGDTYPNWLGWTLEPDADDVLARISLAAFPDGTSVERWIRAHPAPAGQPRWRAAAPPLDVTLNKAGSAAPSRLLHDGTVLNTAIGLTPVAGFSNARRDDSSGAFGLFFRNEPVRCDAAESCGDGYTCDTEIGRCLSPVLTSYCVLGTTSCVCVPLEAEVGSRGARAASPATGAATKAAPGLCQDRTSSVYDASSERGRVAAIVVNHEIGNAIRTDEPNFATQSWATNRFFNATLRTVKDFDPERAAGSGNDYTVADGQNPEREGVFIWGRPGFGGIGAQGRDAQLYLAWVPMPSYDPSGHFAWQPRYFAGMDGAGRPRFVQQQVAAVPLDLDAAKSGEQPEEPIDIVNQMAVSWVPGLQRWVMLYGGDLDGGLVGPLFESDADLLRHDRYGAVQLRSAPHPWGPWSAPERVLLAGDFTRGPVEQYAPGGPLYHPACIRANCARGDGIFTRYDRGFFYAANIVDTWTTTRDTSVDLYWFVSTWNPYQVLLVKTSLPR